jgi:WD40 repeat protein
LALSADGKRCFVCNSSGQVLDFDPQIDLASITPHTFVGEEGDSPGATALALSPDGSMLLTASFGSFDQPGQPVVRVWDVGSGQVRQRLTIDPQASSDAGIRPGPRRPGAGFRGFGPPGFSRMGGGAALSFQHLDVSSDSAIAAAGTSDGAIYLWPLSSATAPGTAPTKAARRLVGHAGAIAGVELLPDNRHVVSASQDGTIRFWSVFEATEVQRLDAGASLLCLALSSDGKRLVTGADNGAVSVWDVPTLPDSPAGDLAAAASPSSSQPKSIPLPGLAALRGDQTAVEGGPGGAGSGGIGLDSQFIGSQLTSWVLTDRGPRALLMQTNGFAVLDGQRKNVLRQVEVTQTAFSDGADDFSAPAAPKRSKSKKKKAVERARGARPINGQLLTARLSADGRRVIAGLVDSNAPQSGLLLGVWDAELGTPIGQIGLPPQIVPQRVDVSPGGDFVLAGNTGGAAAGWRVGRTSLTRAPDAYQETISFSSDGAHYLGVGGFAELGLAAPSGWQPAQLWQASTGQRVGVVKADTNEFTAGALISPTAALLADIDPAGMGRLRTMQINSTKELRRFTSPANSPQGRILTLTLSPKNNYVVSTAYLDASATYQLQLWDVASGTERFRADSALLWSHVSFSPDGQAVAAVTEESGTLWRLAETPAEPASSAAPSSPAPVADKMRTWSDTSGKFTVEAKYVGIDGEDVRLERADGKIVRIPRAKLCNADQMHLKELGAAQP